MPNNSSYIDLAIKRQAMLERLKSGQVKNFAAEIKKIEALIRSALLSVEGNVSALSYTELNKLIAQLQRDQAAVYTASVNTYLATSADISTLYATQEILDLQKTVDLRGTKLNAFTKKQIFSKVIKRPLTTDGQLLEPWLKDFSSKEISRVNGAIRSGYAQGLTNQQLVQKIVGTKAQNYKNGVMQTTRRNASTVVRTSTQHAASAARQEIWEANRDVVSKYQFLATLDGKTSPQCRTLDGQVFEFGKGPIPPIHPNCRSTTISVLGPEFSWLSEGRTRSSTDGPVSANTSYYDWLGRQTKATQIDVLGPSRAALFRDGGMTAERFRALQFDKNFAPLTLDEMRVKEPEAFKKAGL